MVQELSAKKHLVKFGSVLYHYTSFDAFWGMLSNGEFWWGNTSAMNDKRELTHFTDKLRVALKQDVKNRGEDIDRLFAEVNEEIRREYPYAMSLSRRSDDAAQWERYAHNAKGLRIGLSTAALAKVFPFHDVLFDEVYYEFDIRCHEHYRILCDYLESKQTPGFSTIQSARENLVFCSALYKHESFISEDEVRLVTLPSVFDERLTENCSKIEFKLIRGEIKKVLIVNYAELFKKAGIPKEELFIDIMIGPRSAQSVETLREFCELNNYPKLASNISISSCPLR